MNDSVCIQCGQCINVCPTAAFLETGSTGPVLGRSADPELHVVVQTAPSIRATIGEGLRLPPGHAGDRQDGHRLRGWASTRCSTPTSAPT